MASEKFRILSLDGGGAKGFYSLGVLKEIESLAGGRLCDQFHMIFGTSTGSIIAALLALGYSVDEIHDLYRTHVTTVMAKKTAGGKSKALANLAEDVFGDVTFENVKTMVGIVATRWVSEKPMIFKANPGQAFGRQGSFQPGFGVRIGEAVQASCSAYPFFKRKFIRTSMGDDVELIDGGFCANNPTLYAITDAHVALGIPRHQLRVVSIGVGEYPPKQQPVWSPARWLSKFFLARLIQKTLEINTKSLDQLRYITFKDVPTARISNAYSEPAMATDMFERDPLKLNILWQKGRESFEPHEEMLKEFFS